MDIVEKGAERGARKQLNETIGLGKLNDFKDAKGNSISESQFFANIQKGAAFGFAAEGVKGDMAGQRGLNLHHDKDGILDGISMRSDIAHGMGRGESEKYAAMEAKTKAKDKHGRKVSDNEYYDAAKTVAEERADAMIGQASGAKKAMGKNSGIFAQNADYSELSKALSTDAKIKALGGVEGAASIDRAKAMIDAHQEKGFVDGTMQAAMEKVAKSGERLGEAIEHIARDLAAGKLSGDAASINAAQQIAKQMTGQNMSPTEAMMWLAQQRAGNVSGIVSPDGTATYDYRVSGKHAEVAARRSGREEDTWGKAYEWFADTFGDNALQYGAGAVAGFGVYKLAKDGLSEAGELAKRIKKWFTQSPALSHPSKNALMANGINTVANPNQNHAPSSMTPPLSGSHTNVPHHQGHVNIPSGYKQTSSGLIVPEGVHATVPHSKGSTLSSFLKKAATFVGLSSLAGASETIGEAINAADTLTSPLGAITGQPLGEGSDKIPNGINAQFQQRIQSMRVPLDIARDFNASTGLSMGAVSALQHPSDINQSIRSQIESAHALKNMEQAIINRQHNDMFARQLINPVAPARGATFETLGGELTFGQNNSGYLKVGDIQTQVPFSEFRNYLSDPSNLQNFVQQLSSSKISNDSLANLFSSYDKKDTSKVEDILGTIYSVGKEQTMDSRVGLGEMTMLSEKQFENLSKMTEHLEKIGKFMEADYKTKNK